MTTPPTRPPGKPLDVPGAHHPGHHGSHGEAVVAAQGGAVHLVGKEHVTSIGNSCRGAKEQGFRGTVQSVRGYTGVGTTQSAIVVEKYRGTSLTARVSGLLDGDTASKHGAVGLYVEPLQHHVPGLGTILEAEPGRCQHLARGAAVQAPLLLGRDAG